MAYLYSAVTVALDVLFVPDGAAAPTAFALFLLMKLALFIPAFVVFDMKSFTFTF